MKQDRLWSPDGKALAYPAGKGAICLYDAATGKERLLPTGFDGVTRTCWSPDGKRVAFYAVRLLKDHTPDRLSLCLIDLSSGGVTTLVNDVGPLSRDAIQKSREAGESYEDAAARYRAERVFALSWLGGVAWSPDDSRIAYSAFQHDSLVVFLLDRASGRRAPVTHQRGVQFAPAWSPDGRWLAYAHYPFKPSDGKGQGDLAGQGSLWLYSGASGATQRVCDLCGLGNRLQWSADSRRIGFIAADEEGNTAGYLVEAQPGAVPRRALIGISSDALWSPALDAIAYTKQGEGTDPTVAILLRRPASKMPKRLMLLKPGITATARSETCGTTSRDLSLALDFSPDGRQLAVADYADSDKVRISIVPVE